MKCPFELPVTAEYSEMSDAYIVIDPYDRIVAYHCNDESSAYIVQAINSYEKYKIACARAYEGLCTNDLDACDEAIKLLDEITKEAEKPK